MPRQKQVDLGGSIIPAEPIPWGRLVFSNFMLVLMRLRERIEDMIKEKQVQAAEKYSAAFAFCFFLSLLSVPGLFASSPYLAFVERHVGQSGIMSAFFLFASAQTIGILFGVEPSGFIWCSAHKIHWLKYRVAVLVLGVPFWFIMGAFLGAEVPLPAFFFSLFICWQVTTAAFHLTYAIKEEVGYAAHPNAKSLQSDVQSTTPRLEK